MDKSIQAMIDAGAEALRERQQAGRITRDWTALPNGDKRRWREHSAAVLKAAAASDLYEALKVMTDFAAGVIEKAHLTDTNGIVAASRAALSKAEGK